MLTASTSVTNFIANVSSSAYVFQNLAGGYFYWGIMLVFGLIAAYLIVMLLLSILE